MIGLALLLSLAPCVSLTGTYLYDLDDQPSVKVMQTHCAKFVMRRPAGMGQPLRIDLTLDGIRHRTEIGNDGGVVYKTATIDSERISNLSEYYYREQFLGTSVETFELTPSGDLRDEIHFFTSTGDPDPQAPDPVRIYKRR